MRLDSKVQPRYLPEGDQNTVLRLGLSPLQLADWLQPDADFAAFHQHKTEALTSTPAAVALALPQSSAAQEQFSAFLLQHLLQHHASLYGIDGDMLSHRPSGLSWPLQETGLAASSHWIQEDICLLQPVAGVYRLTAASVCSPSNWKLEEKLNQTLDAIHGPVPGYQEQLADRVNRLLGGLTVAKPVSRINWSIQPGNELLWRADSSDANHSERNYWRIERQCLLKIPATDVIIFSIRIYLNPLDKLLKIPGMPANLRQLLANLPAAQSAYKGLTKLR